MTSYIFDTKAVLIVDDIEYMELLRARKRSNTLHASRIPGTSNHSELVQKLLRLRIVWMLLRFFKSLLFVLAICDKTKRPPSAVFFFKKQKLYCH